MGTSVPESDIRIDKEGTWHFRGVEMSRCDIVMLFYRHLQRDAAGRYFIRIGQQQCSVDVEDTAYVVWEIRWADGRNESKESIHLLLSDGSTDELDPATLRIGKDNVLYCRIRDGRIEARFSWSSYHRFAERVGHDPLRDAYYILLNSQPYYIADCQNS
jgi:hypothetical protein